MKARYYAKELRPGRWHVIAPDGHPVYDNAPHGKDKPLVFTDEDRALEFSKNCNDQDETQLP